jgi:hypothetical protein
MTLQTFRQVLDTAQARHVVATGAADKAAAALAAETAYQDELAEAVVCVQAVAHVVQQETHTAIASVVSRCLQAVFPDPYEFEIQFEQRRGRTEARLVFVRDGEAVSPLDSSGGGVVDVAAFALRLACLMLAQPQRRRLVVLDEPFKFVSADYLPAVRQLLEDLAAELGVQFVMVTHLEELYCGKIVQI